MSTVSAESSARVSEAAAKVGLTYLRAPVSGNPAVLRAGNLGIMVSGDRPAFDSCGGITARDRAECLLSRCGRIGSCDEAGAQPDDRRHHTNYLPSACASARPMASSARRCLR